MKKSVILFIALLIIYGNMQTVKADDALTVEGEWIITSSNYPDDSGGGYSIVGQDSGYNVIPKNAAGQGKHAGVGLYYGSPTQIVAVKTYSFDDLIELKSGLPNSVLKDLAGKVSVKFIFTLSADGRSMELTRDNFQASYDQQSGRLVNYWILPSNDKQILIRVSPPASKVEALPQVPSDSNHNFAYVESRGEFYFITKDGRKVSGEEAGKVPLEEGTKVVTGKDGHVKMTLPDNTTFTVGPNSDLVIDKFVYDPDKSPEKIMATMTKGVFRWVTGNKAVYKEPGQMKVNLPVVAVGIRGTDFEATVEPNGIGSVVLNFGQLEITEKKTGFTFLMNAGEKITFGADGSVSRPVKI